jgi:hypothetical protein
MDAEDFLSYPPLPREKEVIMRAMLYLIVDFYVGCYRKMKDFHRGAETKDEGNKNV